MGFIIGGAKARGEWRGVLRHLFLFFVLVLVLGFVGELRLESVGFCSLYEGLKSLKKLGERG